MFSIFVSHNHVHFNHYFFFFYSWKCIIWDIIKWLGKMNFWKTVKFEEINHKYNMFASDPIDKLDWLIYFVFKIYRMSDLILFHILYWTHIFTQSYIVYIVCWITIKSPLNPVYTVFKFYIKPKNFESLSWKLYSFN